MDGTFFVIWLTVFTGVKANRVRVQQGLLEGETLMSFKNNSFASFKGIPYAAPPIGKLRFSAPQLPLRWSGVRKATSHGSVCPQPDFLTGQRISGNEDCLFLNIYSPDLEPDTPLPVMVYIHGGSFKSGTGDDYFYGPSFLMDYGIVLVTLNYRLDVLGFLSLKNNEVPGNAGMKDQVAALKWVKQNIRKFGGDPENVTIFGQSAGGAAVAYHILSPMSRGLFKRAISMSGVPFSDFAVPFRSRDKAFILGKQLGIRTDNSTHLIDYLRNVSADKFSNTNPIVLASHEIMKNILKFIDFVPDVEINCDNTVFLSKSPEEIIRSGVINDVDIMIGYTDKEALIIVDQYESYMPIFDRYPEMFVPIKLLYKCDSETILDVSKMIQTYYFGNKTIDRNVLKEFMDFATEALFSNIDRFAKALWKVNRKPMYKYKFSVVSDRNFYGNKGLKYGISGAAHLDDLSYLFEPKFMNQQLKKGNEEYVLVDRMCTLFTNFAKYGNPTPDDSLGVRWPKYDAKYEFYMEIGNTLMPGSNLQRKSTQFWKGVYDYAGVKFYP